MESVDKVQVVKSDWTIVHGQCPLYPGLCPVSQWILPTVLWTLSSLSEVPGLCPLSPWTLSRLSTEPMGNVQGVHEQCAGSSLIYWIFYRRDCPLFRSNTTAGQCPLSPQTFYTPGIYAEGYIVFVFPFVRSYVRSFVRSFVLPSVAWNLRQSFALKLLKWYISQQLLIRKHSYLDHSYPGGLAFTP